MLSTQDFAQQVWSSLEDIRDRLTVLETEVRHIRCQLHRLEAGFQSHLADRPHPDHPPTANNGGANGASITIRLSRKLLGGGGLLGGGVLATAIGLGKALGWW